MSSFKRKAQRFSKWKTKSFNIETLLCRLFSREFNYMVEFKYTPNMNNGGVNASKRMTISCNDRANLMNFHFLKKLCASDMVKDLPVSMKTNGRLEVSFISYIGWLPKKKV